MTVKVEFTEDALGVLFHGEETVRAEEITTAMAQVYRDHRYPELKYFLINAIPEKDTTTFNEMKNIAQIETKESSRNPGLLIAMVAGDDHNYAMLRIFQAFANESNSNVKVFTNREAADECIVSMLNNINQDHQANEDHTHKD